MGGQVIDEARRLSHHYIGTEHILIGLMREGEGVAAGVLVSLGVDEERVRDEVARLTQDGGNVLSGRRTIPACYSCER